MMKIYKFSAFASGDDWLEVLYVDNNEASRADFIQRMHNKYEIDLESDRKEMRVGCEVSKAIYNESIQDRLETHDEFDLIAKSFIPNGAYETSQIRYYLIQIVEIEVMEMHSQRCLTHKQ